LKLVIEEARDRKSSKNGQNEENTQKPSHHNGEHHPMTPIDKFEANLQNFRRRLDPVVPRWKASCHDGSP
jgi:hypothetical protein